jgi:high-affinity iron transporter
VIPLLVGLLLGAGAQKPPRRTGSLVERGKAVYEIHCIACHGEKGEGDGTVSATLNPRPRNFRTGKFVQGSSVGEIFATLGTGVPGTAMARFPQLSESDRWAVAWYVSDLRSGKAR